MDRYDIDAVRESLKDLIEADNPDPADPRYPAYLEYLERDELLRQQSQTHVYRGGAEAIVSDAEAVAIKKLSGLVPEENEYMVIHTKEAYRAFTGRARAPDGSYERIVGGRKAAASLKALYFLTGNDNPYADWALITMTDQIAEIDKWFDQEIGRYERVMKKREKQGLHYAVLRSRDPQKVELGFKSPYGFRVAELLTRLDYLVRLVKTMNYRSIMTDAEASGVTYSYIRKARRLFLAPLRFEAILLQDKVARLSRSDFLPGATIEGQQRVGQLLGILGHVPTEIIAGKIQPQHGKNRTQLSQEQLEQLRDLQLVPIDAEAAEGVERELL